MKKILLFIFSVIFLIGIVSSATITIDEEEVVIQSKLTDVIAETGNANFTHLNISATAPYDDLLGYWNFDGDAEDTLTTTHYDFTENGNDGTGAGHANTTSTGCLPNMGNCIQLDGTGDYVTIGSDFGISNLSGTITAWFKPGIQGDEGYIVTHRDGAEDNRIYLLIRGGTNDFHCGFGNDYDAMTSNNNIEGDELWHHGVITWDNTGAICYLDGNSIDTYAYAIPETDGDVLIGNEPGLSGPFNGSIDEVMIFNETLTATQVSDIFTNQSARFKGTGKQELNNQSYLNLSGDYINVTTIFDNNFESNVSLFIGYYDGSWASTSAQNITSGVNATFDIGTSFTNITLNYTFTAGPNITSTFYSPIIYDDIIVNNHTISTADTTPPSLTINTPTNITFNTNSIDFNITATDAGDGMTDGGCWVTIDANVTNLTLTNTTENKDQYNITNTTVPDGSYRTEFFCNDSASNNASDNIDFSVDATYPELVITNPTNLSNQSTNTFDLNYTFIETNPGFCWYSNDSGVENSSVVTTGTNWTDLTGVEGFINRTVYCNDTANNINSSIIFFTIDLTAPVITIATPPDNNFTDDTNLNVNFTASDTNIETCWYSNDTMAENTTLASCDDESANITDVTWSEGQHNVTIWVNDSSSNNASDTVTFTIDTIYPEMAITNPINLSNSSSNTFDLNYTFVEVNKDFCWYSNDSGLTNSSPITMGTNFTSLNGMEGINNVTVFCNDSVNHINFTDITFTIDTIFPEVNITYPTNNTDYIDTGIPINYTWNDVGTGIDTCWYTNDTNPVNTTLVSCANISGVTWSLGTHNVTIYINDSANNVNQSYVNFTISVADSINPDVIINSPTNITYNTNSINFNTTATDETSMTNGSCWSTIDAGVTNLTLLNTTENKDQYNATNTTIPDGGYHAQFYCNDSAGNINNTETIDFSVDATAPNCVLISQTPSDLEVNSTGTFEVIINCTDTSELNTSRYLNARTTGHTENPPFNFSYRPPSNNKGNKSALFDDEQILLADGRGDGKWYDDYITPSGSLLFGDNYSYSVQGEDSVYVDIENGTYASGNWATLNFSWNVEPAIWQQMVFLSRGKMEKAHKYNYSVNNNNPLLVEFWNFHYGEGNYTVTAFLNVDYIGDPNKNLNVYFCNSSYDPGGSTSPIEFGNPNCVYLNSLTEAVLDLARDYTSRNSSYIKSTFGINNEMLGGVEVTKKVYIAYQSDTTNAAKGYNIRYANSSSGTNTSFNDSGVAWTSTDEGVTWTIAEFTPDVWISEVHEDAHSLGGVYVEDIHGNNFTNFTMIHDDIGDVNHPIGNPTIHSYNSSATLNDIEKNETHKQTMQILVGIALDPDSVGNVTHNLTLHDIDGSFNHTINASFNSSDDSDIYIDFDTTDVLDGNYRMNVTAYSGDDVTDIESYITTTNFTIDNTYPEINITYPKNNTDYTDTGLDINYTFIETNPNTCWYHNDTNPVNVTITCGDNITAPVWSIGTHNVTIYINDSANNVNQSYVNFTISVLDTTFPEITITNPTNLSNSSSTIFDLNYTFIETNPGFCWYSNNSGIDNSSNIAMGTNWTDLNGMEGINNVTVFCNDTSNNENETYVTFFIDTIYPKMVITNPTNLSNQSTNTFDLNYTFTEANMDFCWYSNNSGIDNSSNVVMGTNWTDLIGMEGINNVTVFCNDSANNQNATDVTFFIDTIYPDVSITYPVNNTDYIDSGIPINYTRNDSGTGIDTCWYTNDTNPVNTTLVDCGNLSGITWSIGLHNVTIWVNDSVNNVNWSYVNFSISAADTTFPELIITNPVNNSNLSSNTFDLNYTFIENNPGFCWYSNDSGVTNYSLVSMGTNWTDLTGVEGPNNRSVFCNDTTNNINSSIVYWTIDLTSPTITITSPTDYENSTDTTLDVNYTALDTNLETCWYSNDSMSTNTTLVDCANITTINWTEGFHNVTVWTNDSSGRNISDTVTFTIDISPPYFTTFANQSQANDTAFSYDIDAEDEFTEVDCFTVNNTGNFSITCAGVLTNATDTPVGIHWLNITVNDSLNNLNSSIMFVNYTAVVGDTTPPYFITIENYTSFANTSFTETIVADDETSFSSYTLNATDIFVINRTNGTITNATTLTNISIYWLNITINDSSDNLNSTIFWINITNLTDTSNPIVVINQPLEGKTYTWQPIDLNLTVTDSISDISSCWWTIDSGSTNTSFTPNDTTMTGLSFGSYYDVFTYCNDTFNNIGEDTKTFYFTSGLSQDEKISWIYFILIFLALVLIAISYKSENYFFSFVAGIIFLLVGIYLTANGHPELDNTLLETGIGICIVGIGMYVLIASSLTWFSQEAD